MLLTSQFQVRMLCSPSAASDLDTRQQTQQYELHGAEYSIPVSTRHVTRAVAAQLDTRRNLHIINPGSCRAVFSNERSIEYR